MNVFSFRSFQAQLFAAAFVLAAVLVSSRAGSQPPGESPVKIRAVPRHAAVVQGGKVVIAVEMDHGEEFHSWPAKEVKLPEDVDEFAIRTEIGPAKGEDGASSLPAWVAAFDGVQYPKAKVGKAPDPSGAQPTIDVPLYAGKAVAFVRLMVSPMATIGEHEIEIAVSYQACNDEMCFAPEEAVLPVAVRVVAAGSTDLGGETDATLFLGFNDSLWGAAPPSAPPSPTVPPKSGESTSAGTAGGQVVGGAKLFGLNLGSNIAVLFLAAAIGGMVLNLTPCVLPVIPIKVLTLNKHAGSKQRALVLGMWMAAGVVAFWAAIGVPMAFISKAIDPSQLIFGTWYITLGIGVLIVLLSLGLMGLFSINLPQSVYEVETKADSGFGSFMFGIFTAILGLPCFGFVAGGLLAAASVLP
ncbi:MAG: cytochrome c biogenesis protein CcdA, partial [Phycisphaerales bacterium]